MIKNNKYYVVLILIIGFLLPLNANNSHLIIKVENMMKTDDTFYITNFIESSKDYRNLGPFYLELLDSLSVHNQDLEYFAIFARAGVGSLLRKADDLQYSNRTMSERLKRNSVKILNQTIDKVYNEWLMGRNNSKFLLKNALDMMKLSYRINTQLQNDIIDHYHSYINYGEIYLALEEFSSALEYFRGAKDLSSQLETQEYADIAEVYIRIAQSNSSLMKDGTIFDYADFISQYKKYLAEFSQYEEFVTKKADPDDGLLEDDIVETDIVKMDAMNVSLEESQDWLRRLTKINNKIFGDYNFVKLN